jgi:hypothetical protein
MNKTKNLVVVNKTKKIMLPKINPENTTLESSEHFANDFE